MKQPTSWTRTAALSCIALLVSACSDDPKQPDPAAYAADAGPEILQVDRSGLKDVGVDSDLDYSNANLWMCRPDIDPNECHRDLDATEIKADGSREIVKHVRAEHPAFDCFYIYPTVLLSAGQQMTNFTDSGLNLVLDPLLTQAARFNRVCEVYAPVYRQAGFSALSTQGPSAAAKARALSDVKAAFAYYLEHLNHGRAFVLLGHSQGSFLLSTLISTEIESKPDVLAKMASAVLLGGQAYVPPGERVGGSFKHVPTCSEPGEKHCLIGYDSFAASAPPGPKALLGKVSTGFANEEVDLNGQVACVEPAHIAGHDGPYRGSYFPTTTRNTLYASDSLPEGITTPFVLYRDLFRGRCMQQDGFSYLEISTVAQSGDERMPQYRNPLTEQFGFGLHILDYPLALDDLIDAVSQQAAH